MSTNFREIKSEMELIYEAYKKRDDTVVDIDSRKYYRIVHKYILPIKEMKIVMIVIPPGGPTIKGPSYKVIDENENVLP